MQRLKRDPVLREGICMMHIPSIGGGQRTLCLRLELLNGWLFKIDSGRIRDAQVRELVQIYQRECYQVLHTHFSGDRDKLIREANEAESLSLRLVMECRHVWGRSVNDPTCRTKKQRMAYLRMIQKGADANRSVEKQQQRSLDRRGILAKQPNHD